MTVNTASYLDLVEKLKVGDIDFAFGFLGAIEQTPDVNVEELVESHSRVIARAAHPLLAQGPVGVAELATARWAMLNGEGFQRNFLNYFYVRGQVIPSQPMKTDSIALLKRVVMAGDLLTILPIEVVRDEIADGALTTLTCETPAEFARVGFLFRVESLVTPQMQLLIDLIRATVLSM